MQISRVLGSNGFEAVYDVPFVFGSPKSTPKPSASIRLWFRIALAIPTPQEP